MLFSWPQNKGTYSQHDVITVVNLDHLAEVVTPLVLKLCAFADNSYIYFLAHTSLNSRFM